MGPTHGAGSVAAGLSVSTFSYNANYGPVIIAELPGARPDQLVLVGAHYDSRSTNSADPDQRAPGADDNGSGSSAVVELARIMTSSNVTYEFTVRFLLFSGEEQVRDLKPPPCGTRPWATRGGWGRTTTSATCWCATRRCSPWRHQARNCGARTHAAPTPGPAGIVRLLGLPG